MEFIQFLRVLYRRKFLLIAIPAIAAIVTYYLAGNVPEKYVSKARLSMGVADASSELINLPQTESGVNQRFSNFMQLIFSKRVIDQVSYQLLLHDLTNQQPFKQPSKLLSTLSSKQKQFVISLLKNKYAKREEFSLADKKEDSVHNLLISMKYDEDYLISVLSAYRINNSGYISVEFTSESPQLSAFIANTVCTEFISYFTELLRANQTQAINYLADALAQKRKNMDSLTNELKTYKIKNQILNLNEEAKSLYGQIADFETKRGIALRDIQAYTATINNIDNKFKPEERQYMESSLTRINQDIISTRELLYEANEDYIKSGFNEAYQPRIDSLRNQLSEQINQSSDKYILNPLAIKHDLVNQKLMMEIQLELSKSSLNALDNELSRLTKKFRMLVPNEAIIQNFEYRFDVASREYIELLAKFNQASIVGNYEVSVKQAEIAQPTNALPSNKLLYVILAGFASFILCVVVIFIAFYFDHSLYTPKDLANKTDTPVLGFLNDLKDVSFNPADIWKDDNISTELKIFKNLMRTARFEIRKNMPDGGILVITSLYHGDGKSFFALNLAHAFAKANKKTLLMDGDPDNKYVEQFKHDTAFLEDYYAGNVALTFVPGEPLVVRTSSKTHRTLHEIAARQTISALMSELKTRYDFVIVNITSLQALNMPQEWLLHSDKIVGVFKAGHTLDNLAKDKIAFLKATTISL